MFTFQILKIYSTCVVPSSYVNSVPPSSLVQGRMYICNVNLLLISLCFMFEINKCDANIFLQEIEL